MSGAFAVEIEGFEGAERAHRPLFDRNDRAFQRRFDIRDKWFEFDWRKRREPFQQSFGDSFIACRSENGNDRFNSVGFAGFVAQLLFPENGERLAVPPIICADQNAPRLEVIESHNSRRHRARKSVRARRKLFETLEIAASIKSGRNLAFKRCAAPLVFGFNQTNFHFAKNRVPFFAQFPFLPRLLRLPRRIVTARIFFKFVEQIVFKLVAHIAARRAIRQFDSSKARRESVGFDQQTRDVVNFARDERPFIAARLGSPFLEFALGQFLLDFRLDRIGFGAAIFFQLRLEPRPQLRLGSFPQRVFQFLRAVFAKRFRPHFPIRQARNDSARVARMGRRLDQTRDFLFGVQSDKFAFGALDGGLNLRFGRFGGFLFSEHAAHFLIAQHIARIKRCGRNGNRHFVRFGRVFGLNGRCLLLCQTRGFKFARRSRQARNHVFHRFARL